MITSTIVVSYIASKFLDKFIEDMGYCFLKKIIFPKKTYKGRLVCIINKTIDEYEMRHPFFQIEAKFPFYHSQILFEELNNYVLFKTSLSDEDLLGKFEENPHILIPSKEELNTFYSLFVNNINNDKELEDLFIEENYKAKIFDIHNSLNNLDKKIKRIEKSITFNPNKKWFIKQNQSAIYDLGERYTPKVNFELSDTFVFDGIGRSAKFEREAIKRLDNLLIKGKKILIKRTDMANINEIMEKLEKYFDELFNRFKSTNFQGTKTIPIDSFLEISDKIRKLVEEAESYYLEEERKVAKETKSYRTYRKFGSEIRNISDFTYELMSFIEFINSATFRLANNPILVIDGEAGIGKSHMVGDIVSKRMSDDYESIFILGQHLLIDENPWTQIFKILQINSKTEEFLNTLNERGEKSKKRIILFIDAINEGRGRYFWPNFIRSFIYEIKKYEWLGLVVTVRSSYKALIFPDDICEGIISHTLYGFRNVEYEASRIFFNNYKIELPNVPLLYHEFQNPLFLKLFCEGIKKAGLNRIPDGLQGITSIIDFFLNGVNEVLSKPNSVDYSSSIKLVQRSVNALIQYKIENDVWYVPYEIAYDLIEEVASKYTEKKGFIENLIVEGVLSKNLFWKSNNQYQEGVYFTYERFEDHLMAQYLLEEYPNIEEEFKEGGNLYKYIDTEKSIYSNRRLIDAFSIQVPEIYSKELFEFMPDLKGGYPVVESFIESLLWRKLDSINDKSIAYVNKFVFSYNGTYELFWETILSVAALPGHFFNSKFLHKNLMEFSMQDRDAEWTELLKNKFSDESAVKRLIDWAWNENDKSYVSDESIELASIAIAWFHTSTNRQLRDCSTKALVCLLQDRINILIRILEIFEDVNDPYVYERLFAVAYGCVLRSEQKDLFVELSEYIFKIIFKDKDEVYPHVLLRDYARGIIEYTYYLGYTLSFDIKLVRPPYKSTFSTKILANQEIDAKYRFDYKKNFPDYYWSQNKILSSMTTEYGRGTGGYGDFGRYTFESALRAWDVNTDDLSNLAIEWIFEKYGYDVEKHGKYDRDIGSYGRSASSIERIGKKYQWIALYEMVARVSDNFKKYEEYSFKKEKEEPYQGPWSPYIRDIDPTMIIYKTGSNDEDVNEEFWWQTRSSFNWDCPDKDWFKNSTDLPKFENLIEVEDEQREKWLVLESYPEWAEPKKIGEERWNYPHKRFWTQVRSYIVNEKDFQVLKDWAVQQDFMGRWMPESSDRYEIFSREYYWSQAHQYFMNEYYNGLEWRDVIDPNSNQHIAKVIVPTESFLWEEEFDKSKEDAIRFLKPCTNIYRDMNLKYSRKEGEFLNSTNEVICFDTSVYYNSKSHLLIRKIPFLKYLQENKLTIIWTVLGEKQIIGGHTNNYDRLEINGVFHLEDVEITGEINTKST